MNIFLKNTLFLTLTFTLLSAHEKKQTEREEIKQSTEIKEKIEERYKIPPLKEILTQHIHNRIIHFPIALSLVALLLFVLALKFPEFYKTAIFLVLLAAITSTIALITGEFQKSSFYSTPKDWVVSIHEKMGIATMLSLWTWSIFSLWGKLKKYTWIWGILTAGFILATGFFGGIIAHG